MARRSTTTVLIVLAVFILIAVGVRFFGAPLMDALASLHGRPGR